MVKYTNGQNFAFLHSHGSRRRMALRWVLSRLEGTISAPQTTPGGHITLKFACSPLHQPPPWRRGA